MVQPLDPGHPDHPGDRERDGSAGQRPGHPGGLSHQQTQERDEYVHSQSSCCRSHGRIGCASI